MKVGIPSIYDEIVSNNINLNFGSRRKYYVYLDYSSKGDTYYYVGKGSGNRSLYEDRNNIHEHYKKQKGLERRIILDRLTETEAFDIENLFLHYSLKTETYLTNISVGEYRFIENITFDEVLAGYIDFLLETTFNSEWTDHVVEIVNQFTHDVMITVLIEAYLDVEKSNSYIDNEKAMIIKDVIKNRNILSRIFLNNVIVEMTTRLDDDEFEIFLHEVLVVSDSIKTKADEITQFDRCIGKLQNNLPTVILE